MLKNWFLNWKCDFSGTSSKRWNLLDWVKLATCCSEGARENLSLSSWAGRAYPQLNQVLEKTTKCDVGHAWRLNTISLPRRGSWPEIIPSRRRLGWAGEHGFISTLILMFRVQLFADELWPFLSDCTAELCANFSRIFSQPFFSFCFSFSFSFQTSHLSIQKVYYILQHFLTAILFSHSVKKCAENCDVKWDVKYLAKRGFARSDDFAIYSFIRL